MDEPERTETCHSMSARILEAASAAKTLADFPASPTAIPLKADTIRNLAREMAHQLVSISRIPPEDATQQLLVEAARTCGDLATLAACNRDVFHHDTDRIVEIVRIVETASETAREIHDSLLPYLGGDGGTVSVFLLRDLRGAVWKASLAKDRTD